MARKNAAHTALALGAALLAVGCAGSPEYPSVNEQQAVIVVDNTGTLNADATIHLIPDHGTRERLGTVRLSERRTFPVRRGTAIGSYRLLAETLGGRDLVSHEFTLARGDRVEWDLHMNAVYFAGNERRR